jgi:hypothetical protein
MRRTLLKKAVLFVLAVLIEGNPCWSDDLLETTPDHSLSSFLQEQLVEFQTTLNDSPTCSFSPTSPQANQDWYFRRIWLRVRAKTGVDIPGLASIQLIPEVEFLWEQNYPEGWEKYKP